MELKSCVWGLFLCLERTREKKRQPPLYERRWALMNRLFNPT